MDGKLASMAKTTVFANCRHRELVSLGRLFEVARLDPGDTLSLDDGRWIHLVLEGKALWLVDGAPVGMAAVGAIWSGGVSARRASADQGTRRLAALTAVTVASVATVSLGAVARSCPRVADRLRRAEVGAALASAAAHELRTLKGGAHEGRTCATAEDEVRIRSHAR